MKNSIVFLLISTLAWSAQAQTNTQDAMKKLEIFSGNWQGTANVTAGPNQTITLDQHEHVEYRLDGNMLIIEGKGFEKGKLSFNAIATITYNESEQKYKMQSWLNPRLNPNLNSGTKVEAYWQPIGDGQWEWGFNLPQGGIIRYSIEFDEQGQWVENGAYSPDGNTWYPSFNMLLTKK